MRRRNRMGTGRGSGRSWGMSRIGRLSAAIVLAAAVGGCAGSGSSYYNGGSYAYQGGETKSYAGGGEAGVLFGVFALFYIIADAVAG